MKPLDHVDRSSRASGRLASILACVCVMTGCAHLQVTPMAPASRCTVQQPSAPTRRFDRVLVIVFENQPRWPAERYFRRVAKEGAVLEPFQGLFHPSFPNYLSMVGGKAFPVDPRDADGLRKTPEEIQFVGPTIADRLEAAGYTWKNYAERYSGEPLKSDDDSPHKFARRHVPFLSYVEWKPEYAAHVVAVDPESDSPEGNAFVRDVRSALPTYSFYSPDLDNDGHDPVVWPPAGLRKATHWLDRFLDRWLPPGPAREGLLIVVTFDESAWNTRSNRILTVLLGDMVEPGVTTRGSYNHYNVLRTIEDNFGLECLAEGDCGACPIEGIWR